MRIGYIRSDSKMLKEEKEHLEKESLDKLLVVNESDMSHLEQFKQTIEPFESCILVVYSEGSILTDALLTDTLHVLDYLKEKEIQLVLLNYPEQETISCETYLELIYQFARDHQQAVKNKTLAGLKKARRHGRIGGRPAVDTETVQQISFLYRNGLTYRDIAEKCGVSVGTVYKYIK